jgi:hypothetical protein
MPSLTSLLARDAVVSLESIELALQRQVLEGGEIDTALLELGAAPENVLASYRAASFALPPTSRRHLERVSPDLASEVPRELAARLHVVPIGREAGRLVLASAWPLRAIDHEALQQQLGRSVALRIATELRVLTTLSQCYGTELPSRLRLLHERLATSDPGELCTVEPGAPSLVPRPTPGMVSISPNAPPEAVRTGRTQKTPAVQVSKVVALGSAEAPAPTVAVGSDDPYDTQPARPSKMPPALGPTVTRARKRISSAPKGPLTRAKTVELLAVAADRDRVLDVFFSFARQYFECTVLFALREERLLGLDASGLPSLDALRMVEVPITRESQLQKVVLGREPHVLGKHARAADRVLMSAIGRDAAQPCVLIPIVIRKRTVALLYGDRGGEAVDLDELTELLETLSSVSGAFERLIQEHKRQVIDSRRAPSRAPSGTFAPSAAPSAPPVKNPPRGPARATPRGVVPGKVPTEMGLTSGRLGPSAAAPRIRETPAERRRVSPRPEAPSKAPVTKSRLGDLPPPPRVPVEALDAEADVTERPTMQMAREAGHETGNETPTQRPPKTSSYHEQLAPRTQAKREQNATRPERPSKLGAATTSATEPSGRRGLDPPSPRTLSQPPPGTGSYALRSPNDDVLSPGEARPAGSAPKSNRPPALDPRREDDDSVVPEKVNIPPTVQQSLRPPTVPEVAPQAIVVDLGAEAERLVRELVRSGPDDERPLVDVLLRLDDTALQALATQFPGPLWFDRHRPRQSMPSGRDLSAIARALYAFEERAIPYIGELLGAKDAVARLCATQLATDRVCPELLWPFYQRLFDSDGQVRLLATESLPLFRNLPAFAEVRKTLREKALDEREALAGRLAALDALAVLRDPSSVEPLARLCAHQDRQLSIPARRALVAITAQDFEDSERKWKAWYEKNRVRHRAEWLIDSLTHQDERVRTTAGIELQKLTQVYYGYVASAPKRDRERAQKRYRDWWQSEGKKTY